ncbi:hypothetical protein [Flavobacterium algicola]|uniref:hypothetical protein n=1 Tax=Flavobacterium algicola TaxID=556529 RepID=UPI001EFCB38F|nr:hypothetical protein [Flavobacterium algicola]MCG9792507.1 hypothetical protein [Flavobacterium algicola]
MKTITFDKEIAEKVAQLVCTEFGCTIGRITSLTDTFEKKVVVFILVKYYGFYFRIVGNVYQMSYLYVPTVVAEIEHMEKVVTIFNVKIKLILKQLNHGDYLDAAGKQNTYRKIS